MCDHLISAAKHRDHVTANQLKQKIVNILTNKHGAWGTLAQSQLHDFWRLDYWEDDLRRRRRFVRNPFGSTHLDVTCKSLQEYGNRETLYSHDHGSLLNPSDECSWASSIGHSWQVFISLQWGHESSEMHFTECTEEDKVVKSKKVFRSQTVASQNPETELVLEGDEDAVSLLQEKEMDNLGDLGLDPCQQQGSSCQPLGQCLLLLLLLPPKRRRLHTSAKAAVVTEPMITDRIRVNGPEQRWEEEEETPERGRVDWAACKSDGGALWELRPKST
ncbi:hypothetical protein FQN60_004962, partial [Etheostoma spectabile]